MEPFDKAYATVSDYFGVDPDPFLVDHRDLISGGSPVLDIGCGQGRNSIPLARNGFEVDALDPSPIAIRHMNEIVARERLPIRPILGSFQDLDPQRRTYGTVLALGLIPELNRKDVDRLARDLPALMEPESLLFITAFGTWDPACSDHAENWFHEANNSYRSPDGRIRSYLEPGELVQLFPGFSVLHWWEGLGPEHRHGDGPVERHGRAEAVLRR